MNDYPVEHEPQDTHEEYDEYTYKAALPVTLDVGLCIRELSNVLAQMSVDPIPLIAIHEPEGTECEARISAKGITQYRFYDRLSGTWISSAIPDALEQQWRHAIHRETLDAVIISGIETRNGEVVIMKAIPDDKRLFNRRFSATLAHLKDCGFSVSHWCFIKKLDPPNIFTSMSGGYRIFPDDYTVALQALLRAIGKAGVDGIRVALGHTPPTGAVRVVSAIVAQTEADGIIRPYGVVQPMVLNQHYIDRVPLGDWRLANHLLRTQSRFMVSEDHQTIQLMGSETPDPDIPPLAGHLKVPDEIRPRQCPRCHQPTRWGTPTLAPWGETVSAATDLNVYCTNSHCAATLVKQVQRLLSPIGLGCSRVTRREIELLVDAGLIVHPTDILFLDYAEATGILSDVVTHVRGKMTGKRTLTAGRALYALSIPGVTPGIAALIDTLPSLETLDLTDPVIKRHQKVLRVAGDLLENETFIQQYSNIFETLQLDIIEDTEHRGKGMRPLMGKTIGILGPFSRLSVSEIEDELKLQGAVVYTYLDPACDYYYSERLVEAHEMPQDIPKHSLEELYQTVDRILPPWD